MPSLQSRWQKAFERDGVAGRQARKVARLPYSRWNELPSLLCAVVIRLGQRNALGFVAASSDRGVLLRQRIGVWPSGEHARARSAIRQRPETPKHTDERSKTHSESPPSVTAAPQIAIVAETRNFALRDFPDAGGKNATLGLESPHN